MAKQKKKNRFRMQIIVDQDLVDRIDEVATKLNITRSDLVEMMLQDNIRSEEWMAAFVDSRFMAPVRAMVKSWKKKEKGRG